MQQEIYEASQRRTEALQKSGIQLFMDGEPSTPKDIAKACLIAEGGGYMRDYTEDESGRIARVDFDRISEAPRKKYRYR